MQPLLSLFLKEEPFKHSKIKVAFVPHSSGSINKPPLLLQLFMFRQAAAILLILIVAAHVFHQAVIVFDYYANVASFAKHCENKSRPMMHCNGKCQMMKKLQEEEKKERENPGRKAETKDDVVLSSKSFFASIPLMVESIRLSNKLLPSAGSKPIDRSIAIFHPPKMLAIHFIS